MAFNKQTGDMIWHSQTDMPAYSSPITITVNETRQIVFLGAAGLWAVSPDDGSLYWRYDWEPRCPSTGIPTNTVTPIFMALVEATPEEYREIASVKPIKGKCWTIPTLCDGKLYLRNQKKMVCLDIAVE